MNIPKYTVIQYIRDKKKIPHGVLVAVKNPEGYSVGYSLCSKHDRFEKRMALNIAIGRATLNGNITRENAPYAVSKMMPTFIERCKKYYKESK
jgi:hypothetical protein